MSKDLINRYKKSYRLQFQNGETEARYRDMQEKRGRSSSVFAFAALLMSLSLTTKIGLLNLTIVCPAGLNPPVSPFVKGGFLLFADRS